MTINSETLQVLKETSTISFYTLLGAGVVAAQLAERQIRFVMIYIIPSSIDEIGTMDELLERLTKIKGTLGQVLYKLRSQVTIDDDFDEILTNFLNRRNDAVHHIHTIPGCNLNTQQGLVIAINFATEFLRSAVHVQKMFYAVIHKWINEGGGTIPQSAEDIYLQLDPASMSMVEKMFNNIK